MPSNWHPEMRRGGGNDDHAIMAWDVATGQCERTLEGHKKGVWVLTGCAGGKLASASFDRTTKAWSAHEQDGHSDKEGACGEGNIEPRHHPHFLWMLKPAGDI